MAGTIITDKIQAASTSQLEIMNGVALTPPTIKDVNGVQVGTFCRAWVNFNGTGTVAIRGSFNVTSITDNGVGDYTVNFTNAMPDANYSLTSSGKYPAASGTATPVCGINRNTNLTTTSARINTNNVIDTAVDMEVVAVAIFR